MPGGSETETEEQPNERGGRNACGEQPLKDACALSSVRGGEAFGKIKGYHDADQTGARSLQQSAKNQGAVTVRQCNRRDADHEHHPTHCHQRFAAHPVSQQSREKGGENATQQDCGNYNREFAAVEP